MSISSHPYAETMRGTLRAGEQRELLYQSHPVVLGSMKIATQPLQEAYEAIESVIVHRDPGTCFTAVFRVGKTTTIQGIREELSNTFPKLAVTCTNAKHHEKASERTFFGDLLSDYGHTNAWSGTAADRRRTLINAWEAQARILGDDRLLLFIDEAQNWGETELTWLRDVTNDLRSRCISVLTVMFGTPGLEDIRRDLMAKKRMDLIGRFLLSPRRFRGIQSAQELKHTLQAYDMAQLHDFPVGSGIAYSQFFLPEAYEQGWRLSHEAQQVWAAFATVGNRRLPTATEIGMQWVCSTVRNFLFANTSADSAAFLGEEAMWRYAVEASGYEASIM